VTGPESGPTDAQTLEKLAAQTTGTARDYGQGISPALWQNLTRRIGSRTDDGCRVWTGKYDSHNDPVTDWGKPVKVLLWHPHHPNAVAVYSTTCGNRRCMSAAHNYVRGYHVRTRKGWGYRPEHPRRLVTGV
jgi:hypothetical protein